MKQAVVYTRFSPRKNEELCDSCEYQTNICREYAEEHGLTVRTVIEDKAVSGKDEFREKLWEAVKQLQKGDTLLVYRNDRLARNVYLMEVIRRAVLKQGAKIVAVTGDVKGDGPEQVLVRQIVSAISEYERKIIGIRTKTIMRAKQKQGLKMSKIAPYGWRIIKGKQQMRPVPAEQEIVCAILAYQKRHPKCNACQVRDWLNANHKEKARGKSGWQYRTVRRILLRQDDFVSADGGKYDED